MASELNHHVGYSRANECWFVRFYPYQTEQQASEAAAAFTRPAHAATDTGLVTVAEAYINDDGECEEINYLHNGLPSADGFTELVTRSQAVELLAAERAENDEAYELGKRDGFSEAVQEIDLKTGGDGEYRYCTDHDPDRHTPDPASMIQRIVERFETLNTMESISEIHEWKERAEALEAKLAKIEELLAYEIKRERDLAAKQLSEVVDRMSDDYLALKAELDQAVGAIEDRSSEYEALEAKLAAAEQALKIARPYVEDYDTRRHNTGVDETLTQIDAVLGGKPS